MRPEAPTRRVPAWFWPVLPLLVAAASVPWVLSTLPIAARMGLGRDQGIFQYTAWAIANGERAWRDFRELNGPLVYQIHAAFLALGGSDEQQFRRLDLAASALAFALAGMALPGGAGRMTLTEAAPSFVVRLAWGAASATLLLTQYLHYDFWDSAQRESMFDWFLLGGLGALLVGLSPSTNPMRAASFLFGSGALCVAPCFGKPTCAIYLLGVLLAIAIQRGAALSWRRALGVFAAGAAAVAACEVIYILAAGDLRELLKMQLVDNPRVYRFIWPRSPRYIMDIPGTAARIEVALAVAAAVLGLVFTRTLPRRMVAVAWFPLAAVALEFGQAKGFEYHMHPITTGTGFAALAAVAGLADRERCSPRVVRGALLLVCAVALGYTGFWMRTQSDLLRRAWRVEDAESPAFRASRAFVDRFRTGDYFPWELRQAASLLRELTLADERVQVYGVDPYLLFLAQRRSATPYMYSFEINPDAALEGSDWLRPDAAQAAFIRARSAEHARDLTARLLARPPEAIVFIDRAPFSFPPNAAEDFAARCPGTKSLLAARYRAAGDFREVHVWLRDDVWERRVR